MKIKKIDDFNHDIEVHKNVLSSMPINNQKNLKTYKDKVADLKSQYVSMKDELFEEIKNRSDKYFRLRENPRIEYLKQELEGLSNLRLLNPLNTPYEKLGIDNILYRLNHFFKNNLKETNEDIKTLLHLFQEAGSPLSANDFVYSIYARQYIQELLADDSLERMKLVFEDIHWKCPDVILHVSMNFRLLYNKYKANFVKYVDSRKDPGLTYQDYLLKRENIIKELYDLKHYEEYNLLKGFMDSQLILADYTVVNVGKIYSKFLSENMSPSEQKEKIPDLKNLLLNVKEYKNYIKYQFVVDDVKKKYQEKDSHKDEATTKSKEIDTLAAELVKINNEINTGSTKGFWIFKKRVDLEQLYVDINTKMTELNTKFDEYDAAQVYELMSKSLSDTSTIYDVFRFALSFKTYLRNCIKAAKDDATIDSIKQLVKEFEIFMNETNISVIKNARFLHDSDISEIISDHYQILNIRLDKELLGEGNIDALLKDLRIMVNSYYLDSYDLSIDLVNDLFDSKKIIEKESEPVTEPPKEETPTEGETTPTETKEETPVEEPTEEESKEEVEEEPEEETPEEESEEVEEEAEEPKEEKPKKEKAPKEEKTEKEDKPKKEEKEEEPKKGKASTKKEDKEDVKE